MACDTYLGAGKPALYEGETGRNAYSRGLEHQRDLRDEKDDSPLWKHCQLIHGGENQSFKNEVTSCFSSCLEKAN